MRAAIGTSDYHVGGETFINRHIALLFGGDTVVICGRFNGEDPYARPLFVRREALSGADLLTAPFWTLWNRAVHSTSRLPFGKGKRDLLAFLRDQKIDVILAEFGYGGKLMPSFNWDSTQPRRSAWVLKADILPAVYWNAMLKGREWLAEPKNRIKSA